MSLLIDGHNLIGQIPSISLADVDDEAQLVMLLRRYATHKRGRRVVVMFDRGVYGHPQHLDGYGVTCYFARSPQDADAQLIKRLNAIRRPGEWALVTSDRRVADVAHDRGVRVISSQVFAARLLAPAAPPARAHDEKHDPRLSEAEIEEWLRLFGEQAGEERAAPDRRSSAAPFQEDQRDKRRRAKKPKRQR